MEYVCEFMVFISRKYIYIYILFIFACPTHQSQLLAYTTVIHHEGVNRELVQSPSPKTFFGPDPCVRLATAYDCDSGICR